MDSERSSEFELQPENTTPRPQGYRRPARNRRKKKILGGFSLAMSLLALFLLLAMGVYGGYSLYNKSISPTDVRLLIPAVITVMVIACISVLASLLCFFLRRQKKGMAITGLVISLLLILICSLGLYAYNYVFSDMEYDDKFDQHSDEDLIVVTVGDDGEVVRNTQRPQETISAEEFKEKYRDKEITFDFLQDEDLPEEAQKVFIPTPEEHSYLKQGHEQISNYLLMGIDYTGASDAIMILSVDRYHQKLKLISIPRDSYVMIPEWNSHKKLSYTYYWGGAQMFVSVMNYNYFMNITDYIAVDIDQLGEIIDYVGGATVDLNEEEIAVLNRRGYYSGIQEGSSHLCGDAAVIYARIRKSSSQDSEINRQGRQREVLTSLLQSAQQMQLTEYPGLIRECLGLCTTSFNSGELMEIAVEVLQGNYTIETNYALINEVPYWGGKIGEDNTFYTIYDMGLASDRLYRIIYEDLYVSAYPDEVIIEEEETEDSSVDPTE